MSAEAATQGWEVYPACSIDLGRHLEPGQVVNIDTEAVTEILTMMSPEKTGKVLFEAVHSFNRSAADIGIQTTIGMGNTDYHREVPIDERVIDVTVALLHELVTSNSNYTQKTAVHELKHAADGFDPLLLEIEDKHARHHETVHALTATFSTLGGAAIGFFASEVIDPSQVPVIGVGVGTMIGAGIGWHLLGRNNQERYRRSPAEIRARGAEQFALQMPRVITIL